MNNVMAANKAPRRKNICHAGRVRPWLSETQVIVIRTLGPRPMPSYAALTDSKQGQCRCEQNNFQVFPNFGADEASPKANEKRIWNTASKTVPIVTDLLHLDMEILDVELSLLPSPSSGSSL